MLSLCDLVAGCKLVRRGWQTIAHQNCKRVRHSQHIPNSSDSVLVLDGNINDIGGTTNASARGYCERGKSFFSGTT